MQLEVGTLTAGEFLVFLNGNLIVESVIVGTIVGNVQLTVTIHHRKVTTTIETTDLLCSHGNEVSIVDIIERSRSITEHCRRIGILFFTTACHIATRKNSIMDSHTALWFIIGITCKQVI